MAIVGDDGNNVLDGTTGPDIIDGKGGNDTLRGGTGDDTYQFGGSFGDDAVVEANGAGNDLLQILAGIPASAVRLVGDSGSDLNIIVDGFGSISLDNHLLGATVERLQIGSAATISLTGGLTMTGAGAAESIYGTQFGDTIDGKAGDDTLRGGTGDDTYQFGGSFGDDAVFEANGAGNDLLQILAGIPASAVRLVGDSGSDLNIIVDGFGSISLDNHLLGATVERLQIGSAAAISLTGGLTMTGDGAAESIYGTQFGDTIDGRAGDDTLRGGTGDDTYQFGGSFGDDAVVEANGAGNDLLQILSGIPASAVRLVGDSGSDLNIIVDGFGSISLDDHLLGATVERLQIGSAATISLTGGLTMTGNEAAESIYGTQFADAIDGRGGNDTLRGGTGGDTYQFSGSFGQDTVVDVSGANTIALLDLTQSQVTLTDSAGDLLISVIGRADKIRIDDYYSAGLSSIFTITYASGITGTPNDDSLTGTSGGDTISGLAGSDVIRGLAGNDTLWGASASSTTGDLRDYLFGGDGNDTLNGGLGNDFLSGGVGTDTMTGGAGRDRFVFQDLSELGLNATRDIVTDFSHAQLDRFDLSDIDANPGLAGEQAFSFIGTAGFTAAGQVRYGSTSAGITVIGINTDADAQAEYQIQLTGGSITLVASDFLL
ncbi:MAG: hypothetical protein U1E17_19800 [Geminicoccaceae bacterium]